MALVELVSNLAIGNFITTTAAGTPQQGLGGSIPNAYQNPLYSFQAPGGPGNGGGDNSLFKINLKDDTVSRRVQGFDILGNIVPNISLKRSKDTFPVDTTAAERGIARRRQQGGIGFPFPDGPTGQQHDWKPESHFGWHWKNKYNDTVTNLSTNGLALTYTDKSPIDDVYNKIKVRSAAWNRNSFGSATDQPFILRGIQRDNNSDPQYWGGFADTLTDLPRGGISTFIDRDLNDKLRLGKFLASPKGIAYTAKQVALQLMNPNVETITGTARLDPGPLSNKFYNPLSPLNQNTLLGVHGRRDTILPIDAGYRYEDIHIARNATGLNPQFNRLVRLKKELLPDTTAAGGIIQTIASTIGTMPGYLGYKGSPIATLTGPMGPAAPGGLGITTIRRYDNTSLSAIGNVQAPGLRFVTDPLSISPKSSPGLTGDGSSYDGLRYRDRTTYLGTEGSKYTPGSPDQDWSRDGLAKIRDIAGEEGQNLSVDDNPSRLLKNNKKLEPGSAQKYSTLAYGRLGKVDSPYNDFRKEIADERTKTFTIDPSKLKDGGFDYNGYNLVARLGLGDYGKSELDRSNPIRNSALTLGDRLYENLDAINNDLVKLIFNTGVNIGNARPTGGKSLQFRAYISSISDQHQANIEEVSVYYNQATPLVRHGGPKTRSINIDFAVPILSYSERAGVFQKLNSLAKVTSPTKFNDDLSKPVYPTLTRLQVGNYINTVVVIESVSYDIDNETPWDIDHETPMMINVSVGCKEVHRTYYYDDEIKIIANETI
jgi:hypothetical protein